eukprot:1145277-Pelagomonas_calceolata.AAC.4
MGSMGLWLAFISQFEYPIRILAAAAAAAAAAAVPASVPASRWLMHGSFATGLLLLEGTGGALFRNGVTRAIPSYPQAVTRC